jgi:hypothetical protein
VGTGFPRKAREIKEIWSLGDSTESPAALAGLTAASSKALTERQLFEGSL